MRIRWLLPGLELSGGVICVLRHALGLQRRGHEVDVHVAQPFDPALLALFPAEVSGVELHQPGVLPEADVQIATHHSTVLPVVQAPGRLRAHFVQHVETLFALDHPQPEILLPLIRMAYSLPAYRIANSSWARATMARLFGYHSDLALNACAGPSAPPPPPEVATPPVVVSFTHRARWKGTADAYQALVLARSLAPHLDLQWHTFGSGSVPDEPWIFHRGVLPHDDLPALYRSAAAVLFTSWAESYPLPPLEAMAAGAVVVTTPIGLEDYVRDGVNAVVVPPREPRAAANALVDVLAAPPAWRRRLQEEGQATARRHGWEPASLGLEQALLRGLGSAAPVDVRRSILDELDVPVVTG